MIDISPVSFVSPSGADVVDAKSNNADRYKRSMGELFAHCMAQISKAPSLRNVARTCLSGHLRDLVPVPNPDILFINTRALNGSISSSVSLTDALLQSLVHGVPDLDDDQAGIYLHHDSVHEAHRVRHLTVADTWHLYDELRVSLPSIYKDSLDEFWAQAVQTFKDVPIEMRGVVDTHHGVMTTLQQMALNLEVEHKLAEGVLSEAEEDRLSRVIHELSGSGIYRFSLVTAGCISAPLMSVFVITEATQNVQPLTTENSQGTVFLVTPNHGVEKFESLLALEAQCAARLADTDERECLLRDMLYRDQALLTENTITPSQLRPEYSALDGRLLHNRTLNLRHKQIEDFNFTLARAQQNKEDVSSFLESLSAVQYMTWFDAALRHNFRLFANNEQQKAMPHWLKYSAEGDRATYEAFQADCLHREQRANQTLAGLESMEIYALNQINNYVREQLGYSVNPEQIFITFSGESRLRSGLIDMPHTQSLLEFALDGLPQREGGPAPALEVPRESSHPAWDFQFVEKMLAELDIRARYRQALYERYSQPETQRAMVVLRDSRLVLSAWAAKLQGHVSERSVALIMSVRVGNATATNVGSIMLGVTGHFLKDLMVLHEKNNDEDHYVLYAPGAPGGRDLMEFDSWRKLSNEVGGWLQTPSGVRYLTHRVPAAKRDEALALFSSVKKFRVWGEHSVTFSPGRAPSFEGLLSLLGKQSVERYFEEMDASLAFGLADCRYDDRRKLTTLNAQIEAVETAYLSITHLVSYREYARGQGRELLTTYLYKQGINQTIDPETVYVDLHNSADASIADFSEYSPLQTLTEFFMQGQSSANPFKEGAVLHSSVGQDLSKIPAHEITKALKHEIGENYIAQVKDRLLNPKDSNYARRRSLYAALQELQMRRAALIELTKGSLNDKQYGWLNALIDSVSTAGNGSGAAESIRTSSVSTLHFKRLPVVGIFRFKNFDSARPEDDLIYTPNAPDGILFRETRDIARSLQWPDMPEYYYSRVRYQDQANLRALIDAIDQGSDIKDPLPIINDQLVGTDIGPTDRISHLETLYVETFEQMITDVDNQSVSHGEVFADRFYTAVRWMGNVLLLPYPPAALAWSYLHTMIDFGRGVVAYAAGDRVMANTFFFWGMFGMWWGLTGVQGGFANQPGLVWRGVLKALGRSSKYRVTSGRRALLP